MSRDAQPLPQLMTARQIAAETGLSRSIVKRLMLQCTTVRPEGVRAVFVRRDELEQLLERAETRP